MSDGCKRKSTNICKSAKLLWKVINLSRWPKNALFGSLKIQIGPSKMYYLLCTIKNEKNDVINFIVTTLRYYSINFIEVNSNLIHSTPCIKLVLSKMANFCSSVDSCLKSSWRETNTFMVRERVISIQFYPL